MIHEVWPLFLSPVRNLTLHTEQVCHAPIYNKTQTGRGHFVIVVCLMLACDEDVMMPAMWLCLQ